ncbi:unnamed protein product [Nippostrongylus brasiliensis]|uniref:Ovule protein n=1 Tax=Nippostrongylus brasiliensis TaxID=27835 RepID=A0A0N4YDS0_NIPBR|nr:unnamed protein product [Nippostrongylus brasiliensis]
MLNFSTTNLSRDLNSVIPYNQLFQQKKISNAASEVFSRPGVFHLPSHPPSVLPTEVDTTAHINPSNPNGFGRTFFEPATRVPTFPKSRVVFETQNEVQELYTMGTVPSFGKQSHRGTTNPWRKFRLPRNIPAEQLSQAIAWEIKSVAESEPSSMPPTPPSITQPGMVTGVRVGFCSIYSEDFLLNNGFLNA